MLHNPKYNMTYISNFLAIRNAANAPQPLPSSPITQPASVNSVNDTDCELDETQLESISTATGKSFTIASILGLKKKQNAAAAAAAAVANLETSSNLKPKELTVMNLSMHNNHNFQLHNKSTISDLEVDNRLLTNRIPLAFAHHHHQLQVTNQSHHHAPHFYQNNNSSNTTNNNNLQTTNQNGPSALQSLQQQFHAKNNPAFSAFHGKEQRSKNEHAVKNKSSMKSKRVRTIFTPEQLERLEAEFERQQYMVGPERLYLAHTLQLTEAQVKVWFQNRRIKWRKHHLEITQQRLAIIRQRQMPCGDNKIADGGTGNTVPNDVTTTTNSKNDFDCGSSAALDTSITIDSELSICTDSLSSSSNHDVDDL